MKNNLRQTALALGKSHNYFYTMRKECPNQFKWLLSFDDNFLESHRKAVEKCIETRELLHDIIYELEEVEGQKWQFSKWLHKEGVFTLPNSFATMVSIKFAEIESNHYQKYLTDRKVIDGYEKYKKEKQ